MTSKPIEFVVTSSSHPVRYDIEWFPRRPHGIHSGLVIEPPVLSPFLYRHAAALIGCTLEELDALSMGEAFLTEAPASGAPTVTLVESGPLALTGGAAIQALLDVVSLEARHAALQHQGELTAAALVHGMIVREMAPRSLMLRSLLTPPQYIYVHRVVDFEDAGAALDCAAEYTRLEQAQVRLARLIELRAPESILKDGVGLVSHLLVKLHVKAAHTLARAPVPDLYGQDRLSAIRSGEAALRSAHAHTAATLMNLTPEPFAPAIAGEALRKLCELVVEIRPVWASEADERPHGPLQ